MTEERARRRLAAILAADVVGYSRLMEIDEAGTLALLKARRLGVLEPLVARHQGRIFKVAGDGVLIEFASVVSSLQCAIELQRGMAVANSDQLGDRHVVLRVGISLGDVMVEGSDLYGEGVNIAARLQALAEPGGILVSGAAQEQVRNKIKVAFEDLGALALKNIAQPVHAYRVAEGVGERPAIRVTGGDKPSIALLPFVNMSGDPGQDYLSDGLTENVIAGLSRFRDLNVIASNSTFAYKGRAMKVQDVSRELGVHYVLEGSVQRSGDRIRINAQLIEGATGRHLWSERYDRQAEDIFAVQDDVTEMIVGTLAAGYGGRLGKAWRRRTEASRPPRSPWRRECAADWPRGPRSTARDRRRARRLDASAARRTRRARARTAGTRRT
jgi:adenylate cyclase